MAEAKLDQMSLLREEILTRVCGTYRPKAWEPPIFPVRINGVDVVMASTEHGTKLSPVVAKLIEDSRTVAVMQEYFEPELDYKVDHTLIFPTTLQWFWYQDPDSIGKIDKVQTDQRQITDICRIAQKPILVADIANKPEYEAYYCFAPPALALACLAYSAISGQMLHPGWCVGLPLVSMWTLNRVCERRDQLMFNWSKTYPLEEILLDLEDARRRFVTRGIEEWTKQYQLQHDPNNDNLGVQLVGTYPEAHSRRIARLLQPAPSALRLLRRAKELTYRGLYPWLDYAVRGYKFLPQTDNTNRWQITSSLPIPLNLIPQRGATC